jgi:hypothetical protein
MEVKMFALSIHFIWVCDLSCLVYQAFIVQSSCLNKILKARNAIHYIFKNLPHIRNLNQRIDQRRNKLNEAIVSNQLILDPYDK